MLKKCKIYIITKLLLFLFLLKVHKIENFFGFDFEFYTVSLLVMLKYEGFVTNNFYLALYGGR
jgi:hypothetical protein